jgi:hypothetical protein
MARKSMGDGGPVWPRRLREYNADEFESELDFHWARYRLNRDQQLGFDSLALLQIVTAATTDPDCNPRIKRKAGDD